MILVINNRQPQSSINETLPGVYDSDRNPVSNRTTSIVNELLHTIHSLQLDSSCVDNAFMYPVAILVQSSQASNDDNPHEPLYHIKAGVLIGSTKLDKQTLTNLYKERRYATYLRLHQQGSINFNPEGSAEKGFVNLERHNEKAALLSKDKYTDLKLSTEGSYGEIKCISNDNPNYNSGEFSLLGDKFGPYFLRKEHIIASIDAGIAVYCAETGEGLLSEEMPNSNISKLPYHAFCERFTNRILHCLLPENESYHDKVGPLLTSPQPLHNAASRFLHALQGGSHTSENILLQLIPTSDRAFYVNYYCRLAAITTSKAICVDSLESLTSPQARRQCISWGVTSCLVVNLCGIAYLPGYLLLSGANKITHQVVSGQQTLHTATYEMYQTLEALKSYTPRLSDLSSVMERINLVKTSADALYHNTANMLNSTNFQASINIVAEASKSLANKLSAALSLNSTDPAIIETIAQLNTSSTSMQDRLLNLTTLQSSISSGIEQLRATSGASSEIVTNYNLTVGNQASLQFALETFRAEIPGMQQKINHTINPAIDGLTNNDFVIAGIESTSLLNSMINLLTASLLFIFISEGCQTCLNSRRNIIRFRQPTSNWPVSEQPRLTPAELEAQTKEGIELSLLENEAIEDLINTEVNGKQSAAPLAQYTSANNLIPLTEDRKQDLTLDALDSSQEDNDEQEAILLNTSLQHVTFTRKPNKAASNSSGLTSHSSKAANKGYETIPIIDNEDDQDFDSEIPLHTQIQLPLLNANDA